MRTTLDLRRILIFLGFAFGTAWATALVIWKTGGLFNSPVLIANTPVTLALVLTASAYMWGPTLAHVLTRLLTREGWEGSGLALNFKKGWRYWMAGWFGPALLTLLGAASYFLLFPQQFDVSGQGLATLMESMGAAQTGPADLPFATLALLGISQAILASPLLNSLFTFGEEFGWRAYLQPKLLPLGWRPAMLWMGLIWGVWHWPIIWMGHNYGLEYPGAPWAGMLVMVWFTLVSGIFLGWITLKGGSVWPAVIGHAALNGIAGSALLFTSGPAYPLLGPLPVGLVGSAGFAALALWLFLHPGAMQAAAEDVSRETLRRV